MQKSQIVNVSENSNFIFVDGVLMDREMTQIVCCNPSKRGDYSIPSTVKKISAGAFYGCRSLVSITIPGSVKEFGGCAFADCYLLTSIAIPGGIETLGADPFGYSSLSKIRVVGEGENFKMVDGVLFDKEMTRLVWCSPKRGSTRFCTQ